MFDDDKLKIRTRSIPTAAAIWVSSGLAPRVIRRSGDVAFEFPPEAEPALRAFLRAKQAVDKMTEEGA